ncbi:MAG: ribonuclease J [Acidobacteria bacterium]|nr:ribonuclease J [Acidobacteriota bacterium]
MTDAQPARAGDPALDVIPLGGLGEFGMNMMAIAYGDTCIVVDSGVLFPEPELLGVDLIIPDLSFLQQFHGRVAALVLTHGHEDHIGAVPHVAPLVDGPIYGTPFTLALVQNKLDEHGIEHAGRLQTIKPRQTVEVGPFRIEFLRVTHSMPDCVALAIHTPIGTIVHTGDFKIDQTPLDGEHVDFHRFAELGGAGVLALFADSTNIDRRGFTGSELDVIDAFEEILTGARGKVVVATFASSIYRMQILVDLAAKFRRKVAFVGRGVMENTAIAARLGLLTVPAGVQIRDAEVRNYAPEDVLCICTGSQDHVARRGAELVYDALKHIHVSGHGSEEALKLMLSLVRPKYFVPIHGEYRQLARHARVATDVSARIRVLLAQNGDVIRFTAADARIADKVAAGRVLIDGTGMGEVGDEVLRDRRHIAADGLLVPVLAIGQSGALENEPELITRGFVVDPKTEDLLREVPALLREAVETATVDERTDPGLIKEKVRVELQRFIRKRVGRRPLVLPVIMEI